MAGPKDDDGRRKWGRVSGAIEFQATAEIADLGVGKDVLMPPMRIRTCRNETDYRGTGLGGLTRLLHPAAKREAVGRVHPADTFPRLFESILSGSQVTRTFGVVGKRRDIEREAKLAVEFSEQLRRGFPLVRFVPVVDRLALPFSLPVSGLFLSVGGVDSGAWQGLLNRNKIALRYAICSPPF